MTKFALLFLPAMLVAQPSFEVATIKTSEALKNAGMTSGWSISPSRNGLRIMGTLQTFIKYAYGVEDVQVSGGPAWLDREMYEINAKAATQVSADELRLMLQSLLADRFKLTIHRESRLLPVYSLVLAKGGSKLAYGDDNLRGSFSSGATMLRGIMDTASFAAHLTSSLGRTVVDNTGLNGTRNFNLTWAPDDATTAPAIFTAIQEQLGLKLESTKGLVEVVMIDHADKPSEN